METAPLSFSKRGELTFHLDGEFSQKTLQLRLNGAHVLQRAQEMELDPPPSTLQLQAQGSSGGTARTKGIFLLAASTQYSL